VSAESDRLLAWEGCVNVRDVGGLPLEDGGVTRSGAIVRADDVHKLSDAGWEALLAYGIRTVIDLRWDAELEGDPPRELPIDVVHVPLLGQSQEELRVAVAPAVGGLRGSGATAIAYVTMLESYQPAFARAIEAVAVAPEGTVLVHCVGGKDRTGLVVALLLRLAGVPPAVIAADYALSGPNLVEVLAAWVAEGATEGERAARESMSASPAEAMIGVLEELDARYGGVRGYLAAAGVSEETIEGARRRLLA
jgi:protein-tyrosine phosphatase